MTAYAIRKFDQTYICEKTGSIRWISSNNVLPQDCCQDLLDAGHIDQETYDLSSAVRDKETTEALMAYIERQKNRTQEEIDEQMFEMRAAFGPGETVVNVFTGEVTKL